MSVNRVIPTQMTKEVATQDNVVIEGRLAHDQGADPP